MEPIQILLIEGHPEDVALIQETLQKGQCPKKITVLNNGESAKQYINSEGQFQHAQAPDLILLDINLPEARGQEVLSVIKNHPVHKKIPVIVLTHAASEKDVREAYNSFANCYIIKPLNHDDFTEVIQIIEDFWLNIVRLPKSSSI